MGLSKSRVAIIIIVVVIVLVIIITPIAVLVPKRNKDVQDPTTGRVDCFPEARSPAVALTKEECEKRGCIYDGNAGVNIIPCYYPFSGGLQYSEKSRETISNGLKVVLERSGNSPFGSDFENPTFTMERLSNHLLRFRFDDTRTRGSPRYQVPIKLNLPNTGANDPLYEFNITDSAKFSFQIIRKATGKAIFDTGAGGLILSDQFLQLTARLPSTNVYGFGENAHETFKHKMDMSWPAFARDQGIGGHVNHYGVHPFYTCIEDEKGNTHGVLMFNSNAQEYSFSLEPMLTFRTIGGILDFYIFLGPTPENVVQQYTEVIGRPVMPAYWALGFQLCRYGYNSLQNLQRAVNETLRYGIPLDVQYADIDHMDERKIFTVDNVTFRGLNEYFQALQQSGMHTIIILDPCMISNETNYNPYERMKNVNGNIRWPQNFTVPPASSDPVNALLGYVWPKGKVVFPDFLKKSTLQVWKELIINHRKTLTFDGLWIDMNEPASFGTNEERPFNWPEDARPYWSLQCGNNTWDDPPYRPLAAYVHDSKERKAKLSDKTICMNAVQGEYNEYRHYDVHSLYGWSQTEITLEAVRNVTGTRSIVITRSTFPGSGKHAGHWLGDNTSKWPHLRESIIGMLEFNLFGIPYIGADICGFFDNTTEELCLRWMQLGSFYPFSRNHNGIGYREQHPGAFGPEFAQASREILETRYWLLPYLYTLFHEAHTQGSTVVRPLHHEFPTDSHTYDIDKQFLWGGALLISPILEEGQTKLTYYLPSGRWYDFFTGVIQTGPKHTTTDVSKWSKPEIHLRGGYVLALQKPANNTEYSRKNPFTLKVTLTDVDTQGGQATGSLFWDDGASVDTYEKGSYFFVNYKVEKRRLEARVIHHDPTLTAIASLKYEAIVIHGVSSFNSTNSTETLGIATHNATSQTLNISVNIELSKNFTIDWH